MKYILLITLMFPLFIFSQEKISGTITEISNNKKVPLGGANVYWLDTSIGSVTDFDGNFEIPYKSEYNEGKTDFKKKFNKTLQIVVTTRHK